jgi:predicted kinase
MSATSPAAAALVAAIRGGATPTFDAIVEALAPLFPLLRRLAETPQDPEWHAEGDVHTHCRMVLDALYADFARRPEAPSGDERVTLALAAALHDVCKPVTTTSRDIKDVRRVVAPRHEERGRSYVAQGLLELGLPYGIVRDVMALVGYHQAPKKLVVKDAPAAAFRRLARLVPPRLVYWLERADMIGRTCGDLGEHLTSLDLFRLEMETLGAWDGRPYAAWRTLVAAELGDGPLADVALAQAVLDHEAGLITTPEEGLARSYRFRPGFASLTVMVGPSGSGKSTWVARHRADARLVSLDDLREELASGRGDQSENGRVLQEAKRRLKAALAAKEPVVWDATSLRVDFRRPLVELGFDYGALVTLAVVHRRTREILEGNTGRADAVAPSVLDAQLEQMQWPEESEAHRFLVLGGDLAPVYRAGFSAAGVS